MPFADYEGDEPHDWKWDERLFWHCAKEEKGRPEVLLRQVGPRTCSSLLKASVTRCRAM